MGPFPSEARRSVAVEPYRQQASLLACKAGLKPDTNWVERDADQPNRTGCSPLTEQWRESDEGASVKRLTEANRLRGLPSVAAKHST